MKQSYLFKALLSGLLLASSSMTHAQNVWHPYAYGGTVPNYYFDYVGERFEVTAPSAIAGDKAFTTGNTGTTTTGTWGGFPGVVPAVAISNSPVIKYSADSCAVNPITIDMTGYVALLYRGASVQFGQKALYAQNKGAIACVIVNNVDGGPVGMAAGTYGGSVTIPVFMVSKTDGDAMNAKLWAGYTDSLSVFNWGQGLGNDLGFVSGGISQYHNGAIPSYELLAGGDLYPYKGFDGAFVANFGLNDATNVTLSATTSFTPTGGSSSTIHTDNVTLASFPALDSIWSMFCPNYNLSAMITGTGTINVNYNVVSSDVGDDYPFDNSTSYSVEVTDNVYCKGRWDVANGRPYVTSYSGVGQNTTTSTYDPYVWGPMYYVKTSRYADSAIFSVVSGTSTGVTYVLPGSVPVLVYLMKWADTVGVDTVLQNQELELQAIGVKNFNGTTDSSFKFYSVQFNSDTTGGGSGTNACLLDSNSWYYVAAEMPQSGSQSYSIGIDGLNNAYPRTIGRDFFDNLREYYAPIWSAGGLRSTSGITIEGDAMSYPQIVPFGGSYLLLRIDSTVFSNTKGMIPNISLTTSYWATSAKNITTKVEQFNLFPNPATNTVNVALALEQPAKTVIYKIMNTAGKIVSTETHSNVQNETYSYNTEKLSNGNYFMIVVANERPMFKKFTVMH